MQRRLWVVLTAVPFLFGLVTVVLQRAGGVVLFDDEMGFLGAGVLLSHRGGTPLLHGEPFYSSGYGLLLALPLRVIPVDPWVIAVAANLVLLAALGPLLFVLGRRVLGLQRQAAVGAALLGATLPSVVLQVPRAWSETLLAVAFTGWVVLLERYCRLGPVRGSVPLAVASGALIAVHRRVVIVVIVGFVVIVATTLRAAWAGRTPGARLGWLRRVGWVALAGALASEVVAALVVVGIDRYVAHTLYGGGGGERRLGRVERLLSTEWLSTFAGQVWTLTVTTFGMAPLGAVVLVTLVLRRQRVTFGLSLLLATGGVVMTSVLFLSHGVRPDHLVYERYIAPVAPVLVLLGVGSLLASRISAAHLAVAAGCGLVTAGALRLLVEQDRLAGNIQKLTVPALTTFDLPTVGWDEPFGGRVHVVPITVAAGLAMVAVVFVARLAPRRGVLLLAIPALVVAAGSRGNLAPFLDVWEPTGRAAAAFLRDHDVRRLQVLPGNSNGARNVLQYRLDYLPTTPVREPSCAISPFALGPRNLDVGRPVADLSPLNSVVYELDC